jgi:hypothetical protein
MATRTTSTPRASQHDAHPRRRVQALLPRQEAAGERRSPPAPEHWPAHERPGSALAHVGRWPPRRLFGRETLAKDERRDGVPFFIFLLASGRRLRRVVQPHRPRGDCARRLDFRRPFRSRWPIALPVIMLLFSIWLFRHPASVDDNGRIGDRPQPVAPRERERAESPLRRHTAAGGRADRARSCRWHHRLGRRSTVRAPRRLVARRHRHEPAPRALGLHHHEDAAEPGRPPPR